MRLLGLLLAAALVVAGAAARPTVHTVIPTECKDYMTWQSLGMFYSHRKTHMAGPMTRIMCCTKEEYDRLSEEDKTIVPTHWAPSYTVHPRTGDVYHAYNKPLAVLDWMSKTDIKEDFVLVIDADMIMREAFDPAQLGAKPGWAVAAYFGYMKGTDNQLALNHVPEIKPRNDTLAGRRGRRGDMAGGFTLMAREDMRRVAPLWLKYTERVREDPMAFNLTGDEWAKKPGDKPWISEMYGYSFGCAKADVWHITHSEHMLYPGYDTMDPPKVLHYGLHWNVKGTPYEFDKHWHFDFKPLVCPPWDFSTDPKKTKKGLFAHPPDPLSFTTKNFDLLRDLLSVEPIIILNAALCERHMRACPMSEELDRECKKARELEERLDQAYKQMVLPDPCVNRDKSCEWWASVGECENTAGWMFSHCRLACKWCVPQNNTDPSKKALAYPEVAAVKEEKKAEATTATTTTTTTTTTTGQQQQQQQGAANTGTAANKAAQQVAAAAGVVKQEAAAVKGEAPAKQQGAAGGANSGAQELQQAAAEKKKQEAAAAAAQQQQQQQGAAAKEGQQQAAAAAGQPVAQQQQQGGAGAQLETVITDTGSLGRKHARAEQILLETNGGAGGVDTKRMPFLASEMFGVQAMVGHHIQMLAVFWGGVLVAVLFRMRRRLFGKRHHFHVHGRHRVPLSKLAV